MYRSAEHRLLLDLLKGIEKKFGKSNHDHSLEFITRLSANFSVLRDLFLSVYSDGNNCEPAFRKLIFNLYSNHLNRPHTLKLQDKRRESEPNWILSQQWVGMSLYTENFSKDLTGFTQKIDYLTALGINLVHLMPLLKSPEENSDGGYAVSNYRKLNPQLGQIRDIQRISSIFRKRGMLLATDLVLNHTSDSHKWAKKARQGNKKYQDFYYMYPDRTVPDLFEAHMPEIFPDTAPGNFTFLPEQKKWVMTVFHQYQWDLNYTNPSVLIEMIDVLLFWANLGIDILRLDATPYLWKEIGTSCQNLPKAHTILKLMKRCAEVVAPGVKFIAEAIVAPTEIVKYLGDPYEPECDIAYNATLMALTWNSLATTKVNLLYKSLSKLPQKPLGTTWICYIRCHDDIGLGFDDDDIYQVGYDARLHRAFLLDYYTGNFQGSQARGALFMYNKNTGDARLSGSLASLAGLEKSLEEKDITQVDLSLKKIILVHALIMSYGGLPMIYSGDEIGLLNDHLYQQDPARKADNRWMHRAKMDWSAADRRTEPGFIVYRIFTELQKLIDIRKNTEAWADLNNTRLVYSANQHILAFSRFTSGGKETQKQNEILVLMNFDPGDQLIGQEILIRQGFDMEKGVVDLYTGKPLLYDNGAIILGAYQFYFIIENTK